MTNEIFESMGYDMLEGLTSPSGKVLEPLQVPVLPSNVAMRYNKKLQGMYSEIFEIYKDQKEDSPEELKLEIGKKVVEVYSTDANIDLQFELLQKTLGKTEQELGTIYSETSLNKIYHVILKRNFGDIIDIMTRYTKRFNEIFGAEEPNPTMPTENSTGT